MKIAVVNSDQRMQEVYFQLCKTYDTYFINEFTNLDKLIIPDILVLPIHGPDACGRILIRGQMITIPMCFWDGLKHHTKVYCGLKNEFVEKKANVYSYYMDNPFIIQKNAVLTAEGVLCMLIDHTATSIRECLVDVIGYGNCGKAIVECLHALQVPTRVIRRQKEEGCFSKEEWIKLECGDVIINTAPTCLCDLKVMESWNRKPIIIDIASGMTCDEQEAKLYGIQYIKAKSLPAIYAWKSAGRIAEVIEEELQYEG